MVANGDRDKVLIYVGFGLPVVQEESHAWSQHLV